MKSAYHAAITGDYPHSCDRRRIDDLEDDVATLYLAESKRRQREREAEEFAIGFVVSSALVLFGIMLGRDRH